MSISKLTDDRPISIIISIMSLAIDSKIVLWHFHQFVQECHRTFLSAKKEGLT